MAAGPCVSLAAALRTGYRSCLQRILLATGLFLSLGLGLWLPVHGCVEKNTWKRPPRERKSKLHVESAAVPPVRTWIGLGSLLALTSGVSPIGLGSPKSLVLVQQLLKRT